MTSWALVNVTVSNDTSSSDGNGTSVSTGVLVELNGTNYSNITVVTQVACPNGSTELYINGSLANITANTTTTAAP